METDQAQCLLLQTGEQILCQACRVPLADVVADCYGTLTVSAVKPTPHGFKYGSKLRCRDCGPRVGGALPRDKPGPRGWFLLWNRSARLLVRSDSWIGWRELGGE